MKQFYRFGGGSICNRDISTHCNANHNVNTNPEALLSCATAVDITTGIRANCPQSKLQTPQRRPQSGASMSPPGPIRLSKIPQHIRPVALNNTNKHIAVSFSRHRGVEITLVCYYNQRSGQFISNTRNYTVRAVLQEQVTLDFGWNQQACRRYNFGSTNI